ncbi:type IV toxin-antitoxin system AbiEi family antitoxin domain-containing protein [Patescibacteria group bacterium]|nr:type IV toxin-antitoxin system AbiEi family antitoxin domain-containing protein [Patescibacteria group bacterium]MCG2694709.1 type IV toxin-antitoxin system AbiEi family antitoxin domain-containing protein [Candidatus Parcubacteria bacterium]
MTNLAEKVLKLTTLEKTVFTTNDLMLIWGVPNKNVLKNTVYRVVKKGLLTRISKGLYGLKNVEPDLFEIASKLKKNSYISFETVLSNKGVIFQYYDDLFLASNKTVSLKNKENKFVYRKLPDRILLSREGVESKNNYFIATAERAICDKIYKDGLTYFDDISVVDKKKVFEIAKIYKNKRFEGNIKKLFK